MPRINDQSKSVDLPQLNRPKQNNDTYHQQNMGAINGAIALRAQETSNSLQRLHERLEQFEDRFADAAVERINSVPLRIEQKIAARLKPSQNGSQARHKPQIVQILDAFTIPEFDLPPAITPPSGSGGALPASY